MGAMADEDGPTQGDSVPDVRPPELWSHGNPRSPAGLTPQQNYHLYNIINSYLVLRQECTLSQLKFIKAQIKEYTSDAYVSKETPRS